MHGSRVIGFLNNMAMIRPRDDAHRMLRRRQYAGASALSRPRLRCSCCSARRK
jgi:hypothetical protein